MLANFFRCAKMICFFDPAVDFDSASVAEITDFKALVFNCLLVRGHANIAVSHAESIAFYMREKCLAGSCAFV